MSTTQLQRSCPSGSFVLPFDYVDPLIDEFQEEVESESRRLAALGWYGDSSVNLERRRSASIDPLNPATQTFHRSVPGSADWMRLIPAAAALDPIYQPSRKLLTSGSPVTSEFRRWLCNSTDARGVRSRAAVFNALAREANAHATVEGNPAERRWLSLACGAAQPVIATLQQVRAEGHAMPTVTLVDNDPSALHLAAQYSREAALSAHVRLTRGNVRAPREGQDSALALFSLATARPTGPAHRFDLVEAMGFLEYLQADDSPVHASGLVSQTRLSGAVTFLKNAYECVKPGGRLIVANMLDTHPHLGFTLNVIQWPYIQPRSVTTVVNLLRSAGIEDTVRVFLPADGVYAVYMVHKTSDE